MIQEVDEQRRSTGWTQGFYRKTVEPLNYTPEDMAGAGKLKDRHLSLRNAAYMSGPDNNLRPYKRPLGPIDPYRSAAWGTVGTFYPDSCPTSTSVDGQAYETTDAVWATIRADAGDGSTNCAVAMEATIGSGAGGNAYDYFYRMIMLFDTSTLPAGATISSATFDFIANTINDQFAEAGSIALLNSTPASNTALVNADYTQIGTTRQAADIALSTITVDGNYDVWPLNATGLASIDTSGITKFGARQVSDLDDQEPTWSIYKYQTFSIWASQKAGSEPRLVVTYTTPSAAITGTIGDGATEQEVRDGGGTILVTLTDDTWVAAGATFDAQRQAVIDGLDAATTPTTGWNNEVRDSIGVASVVRTSDTLATITLTAWLLPQPQQLPLPR